jgi:hypothetical protein
MHSTRLIEYTTLTTLRSSAVLVHSAHGVLA